MTGGYIIIDLGGIDFSESDTQTVSGLSDRLNAAVAAGKPVLFVNAINDDETVLPFFGMVKEDGDGHVIDTGVIIMTVSDDDVSVTGALDDVATRTDIADMATQSDIENLGAALIARIKEVNSYSLTEREVGKWINGKPLYEMTIATNMPITNTDGTVVRNDLDISSAAIDTFVRAEATCNNYFSFNGIYHLGNNADSFCRISYQSADKILRLENGVSGWSSLSVKITIRYTKTDNN